MIFIEFSHVWPIFVERYSKMVRDKDEIELCWKALENKMEKLQFWNFGGPQAEIYWDKVILSQSISWPK